MPSNKPQLKTYVTEEVATKFKIIADKERRSTSNLLQVLIENKIAEYESKNGSVIININHNENINL